MRFLALETNVEKLKKKFLVENEEAVHVTHKHFLIFLIRAFFPTVIAAILFATIMFGASQGLFDPEILFWTLVALGLVYAYFLSAAHVAWKYNFVIVTTQKVVIVEQQSMFFQKINPVHFTNINNTGAQSQFAGLFRCGILSLDLKIGEQGGRHVEVAMDYVPRPEDIAATIEHGIVMSEKEIKPKEEQEKKEAMQEPAKESGNAEPDKLSEDQKPREGIGLGQAIAGVEPPLEKV